MMTARYCHYLTPLSVVPRPYRVLCVAVQSRVCVAPGGRGTRTEELLGWDASVVVRGRRGYRVTDRKTGATPAEFWDFLDCQLTGLKQIQIVSHNCTRVWSLLRLWEEIEHGRIIHQRVECVTGDGSAGSVCGVRDGLDRIAPRGDTNRRLQLSKLPQGTACIEDPPNLMTFWRRECLVRITWWDTRNWGAEIGDGSGIPAVTSDAVAVWYTSLSHILGSADLGPPSVTAASWALREFRHRYYDGGIYVHTHREALNLESMAYVGGRCECRRLGRIPGHWYMVDMRSAYLAVCADTPLPVTLEYGPERYRGGIQLGTSSIPNCIARVLVEITDPVAPYLRERDVVYPIGRFWATLCGPELSLIGRYGRIVDVDGVCVYHIDTSLRRWAYAIYDLRTRAENAGNRAVQAAIKSAGVSLVGKLGQRRRGWERHSEGDGALSYGEVWGQSRSGRPVRYRYIGGECYRAVDRGWSDNACPAVAAWITSECRRRLWYLIERAGQSHVAYCDTDSLIVDETGLGQLEIYPSDAKYLPMGALTIRADGPLQIWGLKHYQIGSRHVCAGLPRGVLTASPDGLQHWYTPAGAEQVADGRRPSAKSKEIRWPQSAEYRHGMVHEDGTVHPYQIHTEE